MLPIRRLEFSLSKVVFWVAIPLRYEPPLKRIPSHSGCSKPYNVQHAISCTKGGFLTLRHNELRENIIEMLEEVTYDVIVKPMLQPLTGEGLQGNCSNEARSDVNGRGFRSRGQRTFFDIRIFDPNARSHEHKTHMKQTNRNKENFQCRTRMIYTTCTFNHWRNRQRIFYVY